MAINPSKDQAIRVMESLAPVANMQLGEHLPDHIKTQLQPSIDQANSMMSDLAAQHLGYTVGDTISMGAMEREFLVDGFFIPEKNFSLYVKARPINKDGQPSVRADYIPVYRGDIKLVATGAKS